jgi:hypothetical protein
MVMQQSIEDVAEPKIIQIELPSNSALWYFEGGVRIALDAMERTKQFLEYSGDYAGVENMSEALSSMEALLDVTRQVKSAVMAESAQPQQPDEVSAAFAPRIEPDEEDYYDDDDDWFIETDA